MVRGPVTRRRRIVPSRWELPWSGDCDNTHSERKRGPATGLVRAGAIVFFVGAVATLVTVAPLFLAPTRSRRSRTRVHADGRRLPDRGGGGAALGGGPARAGARAGRVRQPRSERARVPTGWPGLRGSGPDGGRTGPVRARTVVVPRHGPAAPQPRARWLRSCDAPVEVGPQPRPGTSVRSGRHHVGAASARSLVGARPVATATDSAPAARARARRPTWSPT